MRDTVLSLCDLTGHFVQPWVDAGYRAILVDPQHGFYTETDRTERWALTVDEAIDQLELERVAFVASFPPCTELAVSGARWFTVKAESDPMFQARAVMVAEQCRTIGRLSGAPWFVENPVSVLSSVWGEPAHTFHPSEYTEYEPGDNYTKRTCLWAGGGFRMPHPFRDVSLPEPDDRIHKAAPSPERANFRSATPLGFARAVFLTNGKALT